LAFPQITITVKRVGFLVIIEGTGASITFHPNDKDRTYDAIIHKCKELGYDLTADNSNDPDAKYQRQNIEMQLTEIYKDYYLERENKLISDAEHLINLAASEIKAQFKDQTGQHYVQIERDGHNEILNMDYEEFNLFLSSIYYKFENKVLGKETSNNAKTLLKSFTKEQRKLHVRIAMIDDAIHYDLCDENWQSVKIKEAVGSLSTILVCTNQ
jgi:hypothetical protein